MATTNWRRIRLTVLISTLITMFLVMVSVSVMLVVAYRSRSKNRATKDLNQGFKYQLLSRNGDEILKGSADLPFRMDEEYKHLDYKEGEDGLIYQFGLEEFECSGLCYCDDDSTEESRRSGIVLSRTTSILLAATSSIFAYKFATKQFDEKCIENEENSMSGCPTDSIRSEVDQCTPLTSVEMSSSETNDKSTTSSSSTTSSDSNNEGKESRTFQCEASCATETSKSSYPKVPDEYKCERIRASSTVVVSEDELKKFETDDDFRNFSEKKVEEMLYDLEEELNGGDSDYSFHKSKNDDSSNYKYDFRHPRTQKQREKYERAQQSSSSSQQSEWKTKFPFTMNTKWMKAAVEKFRSVVMDPYCQKVGREFLEDLISRGLLSRLGGASKGGRIIFRGINMFCTARGISPAVFCKEISRKIVDTLLKAKKKN